MKTLKTKIITFIKLNRVLVLLFFPILSLSLLEILYFLILSDPHVYASATKDNIRLSWRFGVLWSNFDISDIVVDCNSNVYVAVEKHYQSLFVPSTKVLYAISHDGRVSWKKAIDMGRYSLFIAPGKGVFVSPTWHPGGFFTEYKGTLLFINSEGKILWSKFGPESNEKVAVSGNIVPDGHGGLYFEGSGGLHHVSLDGAWRTVISGFRGGRDVRVQADSWGNIYVVDRARYGHVNLVKYGNHGYIIAERRGIETSDAHVLISPKGNAYLITDNGLSALDHALRLKWTFPIKPYGSRVRIGKDENIYVLLQRRIVTISREGKKIRSISLPGEIGSADSSGVLYVIEQGILYAVNPFGKFLWKHKVPFTGLQYVCPNGNLYFTACEKTGFSRSPDCIDCPPIEDCLRASLYAMKLPKEAE